MCVKMQLKSSNIIILVVYGPGASTIFFSEFASLLELIILYRCAVVVTGDLNLYLGVRTYSDYKKLSEILSSFGMVQII